MREDWRDRSKRGGDGPTSSSRGRRQFACLSCRGRTERTGRKSGSFLKMGRILWATTCAPSSLRRTANSLPRFRSSASCFYPKESISSADGRFGLSRPVKRRIHPSLRSTTSPRSTQFSTLHREEARSSLRASLRRLVWPSGHGRSGVGSRSWVSSKGENGPFDPHKFESRRTPNLDSPSVLQL